MVYLYVCLYVRVLAIPPIMLTVIATGAGIGVAHDIRDLRALSVEAGEQLAHARCVLDLEKPFMQVCPHIGHRYDSPTSPSTLAMVVIGRSSSHHSSSVCV